MPIKSFAKETTKHKDLLYMQKIMKCFKYCYHWNNNNNKKKKKKTNTCRMLKSFNKFKVWQRSQRKWSRLGLSHLPDHGTRLPNFPWGRCVWASFMPEMEIIWIRKKKIQDNLDKKKYGSPIFPWGIYVCVCIYIYIYIYIHIYIYIWNLKTLAYMVLNLCCAQ